VTGEAYGTGNGSTITFTHTLAAISAPKTAAYLSVTDGTETFVDDKNGTLVGSAGGIGTVNYATGAVSVTFAAAPANLQAITCSYYHETSTTTGILDFTGSGNGQGKSFRQDDGGGNLMAIYNIGTVEYCLHEYKTWQLTTSLDDTTTTNLPYRQIGISYSRAAYQTPDGIILADLSHPTDPKFRKMQVLEGIYQTAVALLLTRFREMQSIAGSPQAWLQGMVGRYFDYHLAVGPIIRLMQEEDKIWVETTSPAFSPVLRKPNKYQTRQKFFESWVLSKLSSGNTYVLKERDNRGGVIALHVLDPNRVKPLVAPNGDVYYELHDDDLAKLPAGLPAIPASEIIHDRMWCLFHPLVGLSPIYACARAATHGLNIQDNSVNFFENMSRPSLSVPKMWSEVQGRYCAPTTARSG
jgi:hypothetical protein